MEAMRFGKILLTTVGGAAIVGSLAKPSSIDSPPTLHDNRNENQTIIVTNYSPSSLGTLHQKRKEKPLKNIGGAVYETDKGAKFELPPDSYAPDCNKIGYYIGDEIVLTTDNPPMFGEDGKLKSCPSQ